MASTSFVAWQAHNWFLNDAGHALGAFLTSSGFAGTAALIAAIIAAKQVGFLCVCQSAARSNIAGTGEVQ